MELRVAAASDAADLVKFNQAMALETEGKILSAEVLAPGVDAVFADPKKGFYVVAENNGSIAGGLLITYEWSDWRNKWFWWIQSVYIVPDERGTGLYSRLYQFVKTLAERRGDVCGFRLYVEKENTHAQTVYEKVGMNNSHYLMFEEEK
ncbi:MAG TPA: GNAT family N-acetyltransferase [Pyrinomonadaceae bacterium]|nr:GNAT family N-acetyltransferase [Pyrinomonadaceae bacterium]